MNYYVITDGKGAYIRHDKTTGKYVPIKSSKKANRWDSYVKAVGVLNNSIPKPLRSMYSIEVRGTDEVVDKQSDKLSEICKEVTTTSQIDSWLPQIDKFVSVIKSCDSRLKELAKQQSTLEKKKTDMEHFIEFGSFNAFEGWKCCKALQKILRDRRKCKDEIYILNKIKSCNFNPDNINSLSQVIQSIRSQEYTPRVLHELFKENGVDE